MVTDGNFSFAIFVYDEFMTYTFPRVIGFDAGDRLFAGTFQDQLHHTTNSGDLFYSHNGMELPFRIDGMKYCSGN